jgi:CxxC motif-containing protein (DUF1111 family)
MFRSIRFFVAVLALIVPTLFVIAQDDAPGLGGPLPGLSAEARRLFELGREDFLEVEEVEDGLGPAFNGTSCAVCHNLPAIGGFGNVSELRAAWVAPRPATALIHLFSIPEHECQPHVPVNATEVARRIPIPLFGAGLVEAIPDAILLALEDPADRNRDGISGRAAIVSDPASGQRRIGRFGWKAQQASLLAFSGDAYRNEMGITNDLFRDEEASGFNAQQLAACDKAPDPEDVRDPATGLRGIDNFTNYMRFLAPPSRGELTPEARAGAGQFVEIGCARCHVPALQTGPNSNPALDRKVVVAFSDFLLHNIGTGDGIAQGAASANEMRTPALWGLRFRRPLLHDGRAANLSDAILQHRGEADGVRGRYLRSTPGEQAALRAFLMTL